MTSDRTAWLELQGPTSSKPNSRASDDWFAHACVCGVAGTEPTSALMVTSPPFGPTPGITTPPLRRRNPGDRSTCHGLLFRTVKEPPTPFTLPSARRVSSPVPMPRKNPCGPIWSVTAAGPIDVTTSCLICVPATVMSARSARNVCTEVGRQPSPQLWVMPTWPRTAVAVTVVPPPDAVATGPGDTSNVSAAGMVHPKM